MLQPVTTTDPRSEPMTIFCPARLVLRPRFQRNGLPAISDIRPLFPSPSSTASLYWGKRDLIMNCRPATASKRRSAYTPPAATENIFLRESLLYDRADTKIRYNVCERRDNDIFSRRQRRNFSMGSILQLVAGCGVGTDHCGLCAHGSGSLGASPNRSRRAHR
jgi:hypothetical protein